MAKIIWTEEANRWLQEIHRYIASDSPVSSQKIIMGIYEKVQSLQRFPLLGYLYRQEPDGEVRILLYGHYKIAYQLKPEESIVILGVFHDALDLERYLP